MMAVLAGMALYWWQRLFTFSSTRKRVKKQILGFNEFESSPNCPEFKTYKPILNHYTSFSLWGSNKLPRGVTYKYHMAGGE